MLDPQNPMRTIEVRGTFELEQDPDYTFADRAIAHYGNPFNARDLDQPGETRWVATLRPSRVNVNG